MSNYDITEIDKKEDFIKKYKGAILLVSHDRDFLDALCNKIVELEDGSKIGIEMNTNVNKHLINRKRGDIVEYEYLINQLAKENKKFIYAYLTKPNGNNLVVAVLSDADG